MAYRTPDVYIKEISVFPPSVAEVETAVPAFIGYTEKAMEFSTDDLRNKATRIKSLLDYEELFGRGPDISVDSVEIDENNAVVSHTLTTSFYLYDALRLYFKNGGGKCYIISVGSYEDSVSRPHFETGLAELKKQDEPTMILFPDAVKLDSGDLYDLQRQALMQCNDLMDRVGIFDLLEASPSDPTFDWADGIEGFRQNIGMNYLKYGAAYTPWLKANLGLDLRYRNVRGKIKRGGVTITLSQLTKDDDVKNAITDLDNAVENVNKIDSDLEALRGTSETLKARYQVLLDEFKADPDNVSKFEALFTLIYQITVAADKWVSGTEPEKLKLRSDFPGDAANIRKDVENQLVSVITPAIAALVGYDKAADSALSAGTFPLHDDHTFATAELTAAIAAATDDDIYGDAGDSDEDKMGRAEPEVTKVFNQVNAGIQDMIGAAANYETIRDGELIEMHPIYKGIIKSLNSSLSDVPPSGAVAGIYAMVDASRGVWKAPANVSVAGVIEPTKQIDNVDQGELNIDTVAGKSINAIRAFTGKGTLVWGARTLAGNDNEWRYVSVRRFFNMVEESVKKSTYWAVFEPNDANTWIKVKSMIENYLLQKWRDGALQGAKPEQAFFVKVGLGVTMTAQDILEGRMNVEIGMAVVRPAEFIILKFSHKLPEA